jgi:hypothetical protein
MKWQNVIGVLCAAVLLFSRCPSHLLHPEFWAEDGADWLQYAYNYGLSSLTMPAGGYLQTLSRLGGLIAVQFPLTYAPLIFAVIAFIVQLSPVMLLLSRRGEALLPSLPARLLIVLYYVGVPNSYEVYINLTNAMWCFALTGFLLLVLPKPQTVAGTTLEAGCLVLVGLSGPFSVFLAPLAWWQVVELRRCADAMKRVLYAVLLTLCALLQAAYVEMSGQNRLENIGATFSRLVHILADQIFLGGIIGGKDVWGLLRGGFWVQTWPAALWCLFAVILGLIAFYKGPSAYRQLAVMATLMLGGALKAPMVSEFVPQWKVMQYPGIGDRYYIIPMIAWFSALVVVAAGELRFGLHWVARGLVVCCAVGMVTDWSYTPYVPVAYHEAAKMFDRAPVGTAVTFPGNPPGWQFTLTKH